MVHAFITSRIDYCNSLLYGISRYSLNRFQRIQKSAESKVAIGSKYDHITQILHKLPWLLVDQRVHFKVMLTTYKAVKGEAPE